MNTSTIQQKFEDPETWKRIGLVALFSVIFFLLARWLIWVLVVAQLLFVLFAGHPQQTLSKLCADLSKFMYRCLLFITWTSNELPYPIAEETIVSNKPRVRTCLWFDHQGEEAARFYVSLLPGSHIETIYRPDPDRPPLIVEFTLAGAPYMILNGGPHFTHTPAASISVLTKDQAETDRTP